MIPFNKLIIRNACLLKLDPDGDCMMMQVHNLIKVRTFIRSSVFDMSPDISKTEEQMEVLILIRLCKFTDDIMIIANYEYNA